jgi:hypothetical protein
MMHLPRVFKILAHPCQLELPVTKDWDWDTAWIAWVLVCTRRHEPPVRHLPEQYPNLCECVRPLET